MLIGASSPSAPGVHPPSPLNASVPIVLLVSEATALILSLVAVTVTFCMPVAVPVLPIRQVIREAFSAVGIPGQVPTTSRFTAWQRKSHAMNGHS